MTSSEVVLKAKYLILVRHGEREKPYDVCRKKHHLRHMVDRNAVTATSTGNEADREVSGWPASLSLAGWLAEFLLLEGIAVKEIFHSDHVHAKETAEAYRAALQPQEIIERDKNTRENRGLSPEYFWHQPNSKDWRQPLQDITIRPDCRKEEAIVLCGHQPQLTWIAQAYTGIRNPLPLRHSEAAVLQIAPRPIIRWVIADGQSHAAKVLLDDLREKIRVKLDVAKWFAGFTTLLLGLFLKDMNTSLLEASPVAECLVYLSASLIQLAVGFSIATVFAYDQLLMPSLFWTGKPRKISDRPRIPSIPSRPPSQIHWVLYFNMRRVWRYLFFCGTVSPFLLGLAIVVPVALNMHRWWALLSVVAVLIPVIGYLKLRPDLGFDD